MVPVLAFAVRNVQMELSLLNIHHYHVVAMLKQRMIQDQGYMNIVVHPDILKLLMFVMTTYKHNRSKIFYLIIQKSLFGLSLSHLATLGIFLVLSSRLWSLGTAARKSSLILAMRSTNCRKWSSAQVVLLPAKY